MNGGATSSGSAGSGAGPGSAESAGRGPADLLVTAIGELVLPEPSRPGVVRRIRDGAVAVAGRRVLAAGARADVERDVDGSRAEIVEAAGGLVCPGFVDCHTHLLFGGSRAGEYVAGLAGPPDVEAIEGPTGIAASVAMTRAASDAELLDASTARLDAMLRQGTTTAESKTGYGLSVDEELRLLRLNRRLDEAHPVDLVSTLMAAHAFPPEAASEAAWVDTIVEEIVPAAVALGAEFNDVFCDEGYFDVEQSRRVLEAGREAGLAPKIHADQYARLGAAGLAAELRVVSADHLNRTTDADLEALAEAGVVGVLMPLIDFAVAHARPVDGRRWVRAGLPIALATDLCPGGWAVSMPLAMQFACRVSALTPEEALWAATVGGARAVGRADRGALETGELADLVVIDVPSLDELVYRIGHAPLRHIVKRGSLVR
ncbi:MAG: imidazolonepropionase [Gemmatimonadota bacterium]